VHATTPTTIYSERATAAHCIANKSIFVRHRIRLKSAVTHQGAVCSSTTPAGQEVGTVIVRRRRDDDGDFTASRGRSTTTAKKWCPMKERGTVDSGPPPCECSVGWSDGRWQVGAHLHDVEHYAPPSSVSSSQMMPTGHVARRRVAIVSSPFPRR